MMASHIDLAPASHDQRMRIRLHLTMARQLPSNILISPNIDFISLDQCQNQWRNEMLGIAQFPNTQ